MRTNIEIDDDLMGRVMATGLYKSKRAAVEAGLAVLAKRDAYQKLLDLAGTVEWEGDLESWRTDKTYDVPLATAAE